LRTITRFLVVAAVAAQVGCASLVNTIGGERRPYAGVQADAHIIGALFDTDRQSPANLFQWPFAFVDMPFSLVMDTLLLPYTAMEPTVP
jgi:uncharacterized protein YceK